MVTTLAAIALVSSQARHLIQISGESAKPEIISGLQEKLGPSYLVSRDVVHRGKTFLSSRYLMDMSPPPGGLPSWQKWMETFYTRAKALLDETSMGAILLVPPCEENREIMRTQFAPLMRQIGRETKHEVIDLSNETDLVRGLYLALVDVEHGNRKWRVMSATSEESEEGPARNAIDGDPSTYWHTRWSTSPSKVPHEIVIDLGAEANLAGVSYLARQDGGVNGRVSKFEIFVSNDRDQWTMPVLAGMLKDTSAEQKLVFDKAISGRYLRFVALSEVNGNIWTSIAELGIIRSGISQ